MNAQVMPVKTNAAQLPSELQTRTRKLLLKKREIAELFAAKQGGHTIVPTKIITKGRYIKLELAIAKGKRQYDKRQTIKKRDQERDARQKL
jgi:SsrA-binding protein